MNCRTHEHRHFERTLRSTDTIPGPRLAEGRFSTSKLLAPLRAGPTRPFAQTAYERSLDVRPRRAVPRGGPLASSEITPRKRKSESARTRVRIERLSARAPGDCRRRERGVEYGAQTLRYPSLAVSRCASARSRLLRESRVSPSAQTVGENRGASSPGGTRREGKERETLLNAGESRADRVSESTKFSKTKIGDRHASSCTRRIRFAPYPISVYTRYAERKLKDG